MTAQHVDDPSGMPVHRFVVVAQADVVHATAGEAQDWLRQQLDDLGMDPGDQVQVVSITEVTR
jgi:Fe2+ transport system protein FeoA